MKQMSLKIILCVIFIGESILYGAQEVRIASHVSNLSPLYYQAKDFVKKVNEKLPNRFNFKIYPNAQLGKEKALITNVKAGSIEMIIVASGVLKLDKRLEIFDLPWLFKDRDNVIRAMKSGLEDKVKKVIEDKAGVIVLGIYENGFRNVMNSKKAIYKPEDLKGLKIRISGGKFRQNVFRNMGASPQKVAWKETFTALQTGVVDGAEAATYGFYGQKLYEVMNYFSITHHVYTPSFLIASKSFFNSLTPNEQQVLKTIGKNMTEQSYKNAAVLETKYLNIMKTKVNVNSADINSFQKEMSPIYIKYEKKFGSEWLNIIRSSAEK